MSLHKFSMPQVDLEAFVSSVCIGGSDHRKIACETLVDDPTTQTYYYYNKNSAVSPNDFPPESYYVSKDDQFEWLRDNAFFNRNDSQRGYSGNLNTNPHSNPSSQRYLLKSKTSIIGLPKPQETCFNEVKQRRHGGKNRVILKRFGSRIRSNTSLLEPSSPKVSCTGRVKSRRQRSCSMHRQRSSRVDPKNRVKKPRFLARFRAIFSLKGGCKDVSASGTHAPPINTHDIMSRLPKRDVEKSSFDDDEPVAPGLRGMTRFASGRRGDLLGKY